MKTIILKKSKNESKKFLKNPKKSTNFFFTIVISPPYLNLTPSFQIPSPILETLHITNNKRWN